MLPQVFTTLVPDMKAIKIDVSNRCVELINAELVAEPGQRTIQEILDCDIYLAIPGFTGHSFVWVYMDGSTIYKEFEDMKDGFYLDFLPERPIFGNALIFERNDEGERADITTIGVQHIAEMITFIESDEKQAAHKKQYGPPDIEFW